MNLLFADTEVEHDVKAAIFSKAADHGIENIPYVNRWFIGHNVKLRKLMLQTRNKQTKQCTVQRRDSKLDFRLKKENHRIAFPWLSIFYHL